MAKPKLIEEIDGLKAHDAKDASTSQKGHVQLTSAVNSASETLAATAKAVKTVNDKVEARISKDAEILRQLEYQRINYSNF